MIAMNQKKVFVFGIDGAPPNLVFGEWIDDLPNIKKLMKSGSFARLNSTIPPSTIIAWNSLLSGKDASEIGVFNYTYKDEQGNSKLVDSKKIKCDLIFDILGKENKKSVSLFVPLSYPVKPINGTRVSGFLTPGPNDKCCYPQELIEKIKSVKNPELFFDVAVGLAGHKGMEIKDLIEKTYEMTDMQIDLIKDLVKGDWDFFMSVIIGTDRMQHMLWRHFDKTHRRFIENSEFKDALKNYYSYLDKKLGEVLSLLDKDTTVIVCSDHGMIKQEGKININNWLIQEGYLKLKEGVDLSEKKRFNTSFVDMENSKAYGGGAYNARVYIKQGPDYEKIKQELIEKIKQIPDDKGNKLDTKVFDSKEIYKNPDLPECPDLTVYFDDLRWASNPDLGQEGLYSWETAVGADNAGHSRQGIFVISGENIKQQGNIGEIDIKDIAPTVLNLLDAKIPDEFPKPVDVEETNYFYEASLIDSLDGMQFKVYASSHPHGFVIAKPKYIPDKIIDFVQLKKRFMFSKSVTRFNLFKSKEIVEENLSRFKEKFPEYFYYCEKHKNWFLGVPKNKVSKFYDCKQGLSDLMKIPDKDLDPYLSSTKDFINLIMKSGVNLENIGISHSTLLGNYTPGKSDIDVIVFGKENGWKVINFLEKATHPDLKWKSNKDWAKYYEERVVSKLFNKQEYVFNMVRKRDDGFFRGNVFSVFIVEKPEEHWYDWEEDHTPLATVKLKAKVKDDYNSIVRPGFYEIEKSKIIEGYDDVPVKRIVTWSRPFVLQAKKGENVEACGLLEKVSSSEGEFYQLVIGYFDTYTNERGEKEYLKAEVENALL